MVKRRKNKNSINFKIALVFIACAAAFYWWEERQTKKDKKSLVSSTQTASIKSNTSETKASTSEKLEATHTKARDFFPSNVWEEDEKQINFDFQGKHYQLVSLGLIPDHTKKTVKNTDSLKPYLLLLEKNPNGWQKVCEFSFNNASFKETLVGLPRISKSNISDLDQDSNLEILVYLDTQGTWGEALAALQLKNNQFQWLKKNTSDLAIWSIGATAQSSRKINLSSQGISGKKNLVEQVSLFDPQKPELGAQNQIKEWVLKDSVFVEKQYPKAKPGDL